MSGEVRSWRLHMHIDYTLTEFARWINPIVRGWMQYYGAFYQTELYPLLRRINYYLMRWVRKKFRRLKTFKKFHKRWISLGIAPGERLLIGNVQQGAASRSFDRYSTFSRINVPSTKGSSPS
nr:group II intron maturase-specific domain-containing protein [Streptomyces finlayi]